MSRERTAGFLSNRIFDSRIKFANIQKSEKWLGYFFGPCLMYMAYYGVAGTYLTQFYTDVLGIAEGAGVLCVSQSRGSFPGSALTRRTLFPNDMI